MIFMSRNIKCKDCKGIGYFVIGENECKDCKGTGKTKSVSLNQLSEKDLSKFMKNGAKCSTCNGTGKIPLTKPCKTCNGIGRIYNCIVCGKKTEVNKNDLCDTCAKKTLVYSLGVACNLGDVEIGKTYIGVVDDIANFGAFINLNDRVRGLARTNTFISGKPPEIGEKILVKVNNIQANGNIELIPQKVKDYVVVEVEKELPRRKISELQNFVGKLVQITGEVIQIKQTAGPTIFTISDETGILHCAGFETAGERAYPEIQQDMLIKILGEVETRNNQVQIEISSMKQLWGGEATIVKERIEKAIDKRAEPALTNFLIESEILEQLKPKMRNCAQFIKKAVYKSRPIILRYHADADGITSAIAIERAILPLIREVGGAEAEYYYYRRSPSKAPFYELEDITKDLIYALEDQERFGQKIPLIVLMDNGSTEEDLPAIKKALVYGMDIIVVDHHHPDDIIDQYLIEHVNPAHAGGDYGITTGMLGVEIARMINPNITEEIKHLPAISAVGDRSEAEEGEKYIELVKDKYSVEDLKKIALALDYEAYWLRFNDGKGLINDILNFGRLDRHRKLVNLLSEQAQIAIEEQMKVCLNHVKTQKLKNGAFLNVLDVENYAHKFTFPPPGKTTGEIHDRMCHKYPKDPVVTIGYGPDFAVLRSKGVKMNIPQIVRELREEIKGAGVNGGGHLVVGSIKFVEGMRKEVLARLAEKIGDAELGIDT